jgi:CubicO group peptidase (beta-lactamase class C family)
MRIMLSGGLIPGEKTRSLSQDTVRLFTTKVSSLPYNNTRGIGYETKPNGKYPPCGSKFSNNSFGFNNSLGSYAWADKDNNLVVVLLVSGTMPGGVGPGERL